MGVSDRTVPFGKQSDRNAVVNVEFAPESGFVVFVADATLDAFVSVPLERVPPLFVPDTAVEITFYADVLSPTPYRAVLRIE